jgi:hypothetical protein
VAGYFAFGPVGVVFGLIAGAYVGQKMIEVKP